MNFNPLKQIVLLCFFYSILLFLFILFSFPFFSFLPFICYCSTTFMPFPFKSVYIFYYISFISFITFPSSQFCFFLSSLLFFPFFISHPFSFHRQSSAVQAKSLQRDNMELAHCCNLDFKWHQRLVLTGHLYCLVDS